MADQTKRAMPGADGWITIKRLNASDPRRAIAILRGPDGRFRYDVLQWQRYYDPSAADQGPVEGGLWGGKSSGFYATAEDAERDALAPIHGRARDAGSNDHADPAASPKMNMDEATPRGAHP